MSHREWVGHPEGFLIREVAIFDFHQLATVMKKWCKALHYDYTETAHELKDTDVGTEIKIKWFADREVTHDIQYNVKLGIKAKYLTKVKVEGKMLYSGDIEITIWSWIEVDWRDSFEKDLFSRFLGRLYNRYILKDKLDNVHKPQMYEDIASLKDAIKGVLHLYK